MIKAIRSVHSKGVIHVDANNGNFCLAKGESDPTSGDIYAIDFGISEIYRDEKGKLFPWT